MVRVGDKSEHLQLINNNKNKLIRKVDFVVFSL